MMDEDIETTVDPSFVIHMIRQLLPVQSQENGAEALEKSREEAGCTLWDLSATESQAELMVNNYILDILLALLQSSVSPRMAEISLGILGNMACHARVSKMIPDKPGMLATILEQMNSSDSQTLVEAYRLMKSGLHSDHSELWIEAVQSDEVFHLERFLWTSQNTLNTQLQEHCLEVLLAMIDNRKKFGPILLRSLVRLGLLDLMTNLIKSELEAMSNGKSAAVLDLLLQVAQEVAFSSEFGKVAANDEQLVSTIFQAIHSTTSEDTSSAVIAMVVLANLVGDNPQLVPKMCGSPGLVEDLLQLVPDARSDTDIEFALWTLLQSVCKFSAISSEPKLIDVLLNVMGTLVNELDEMDPPGLKELKCQVINDLGRLRQ